MAFDRLGQPEVDSPNGDMLTLLARSGATATLPPTASCIDSWTALAHSDGTPTGDNLFDAISGTDGDVGVGIFTTSPEVATAMTPTGEATVAVGSAGVPGLEPWPTEKLALETTRADAIKHVSDTMTDSVTVLHSDLFAKAAAAPDAANLGPIATTTADDLVDVVVSAADARPTRRNEDWLFIVVGCSADGAPVIVEGDRVNEPSDLGPIDGPSVIASIVAGYLDVDTDGWPAVPADLLVGGS